MTNSQMRPDECRSLLSGDFWALASISQHQKRFSHSIRYGTAGFRDNADSLPLDSVMFAVGCVAGVRARVTGKVTGVMVTASHNEEHDNGCKIVDPDGSMLAESWEHYAEQAANASDTSGLASVLLDLLNSSKSQSTGLVFIGWDTRESSERLVRCVERGVKAVSAISEKVGLTTTPYLHHLVRGTNGFGKPGVVSFEGYIKKIIDSYSEIVQDGRPAHQLFVDCAGGVGFTTVERLQRFINMEICNPPGSLSLNKGCGAEFVQKERKPPAGGINGVVASLDGDADRLVYSFYDKAGQWRLLDGDKIASLFGLFIQKNLHIIGLDDIGFVAVQTAYANGASTAFLKMIGINVQIAKTGVKFVEAVAHKHPIGMYFEANGHGTVIFKPDVIRKFEQISDSTNAREAANKLIAFSNLLNQAVGDAVADMLAVEAALIDLNMTISDWDALYDDLPSRQGKVTVPDRMAVKCSEDETFIIAPTDLAERIGQLAKSVESGRGFVRPSGTEDAVRIYAEAATQAEANALAYEIAQSVSEMLKAETQPEPSRFGL